MAVGSTGGSLESLENPIYFSTRLEISPSFTRVLKCCPELTSLAQRMTFPVAASIVIE
jgi:hypothetical protein